MLYQLRKLSEEEKQVVLDAPIWAGLLIGISDGHITPEEGEKMRKVIRIKTYSERNDVHFLYSQMAEDELDSRIVLLEGKLSEALSTEEKVEKASAEVAKLNSILPKLEKGYANQFVDSLRDIALSVAKESGGIFGIGSITDEERKVLDLPMITY